MSVIYQDEKLTLIFQVQHRGTIGPRYISRCYWAKPCCCFILYVSACRSRLKEAVVFLGGRTPSPSRLETLMSITQAMWGCVWQVRKTVEREVRVLKALAHVNIVSLLDVFQARGRVCLVFEYVERTVLDCLKLQPRGLGDAATRRIMWQLVTAVKYLHSQKVAPTLTFRPAPVSSTICAEDMLMKFVSLAYAPSPWTGPLWLKGLLRWQLRAGAADAP
jgi:serine/threonine protein kinase